MHESLPKTYPYNTKMTTTILSLLFFVACAAVLAWKATSNEHGLILDGIFTFTESGASTFYWILAALSLGFVLIGALLMIERAMGPVNLEITESTIRIPRGFIKRVITEIQLAEVVELSEVEVQKQRFFYLHTPGKKYFINESLMPSKENYEEVKVLITSVISASSTNDN